MRRPKTPSPCGPSEVAHALAPDPRSSSVTTAVVTLSELRTAIEQQAALMVAVATGGPQINLVQDQYLTRRDEVQRELQRLGLDDPNPFRDLWAWYGYYSQNLGRWHERRTYISEMYEPLYAQLDGLAEQDVGTRLEEEDRTGWERVDDQIVQLRQRYRVALTVEDFQAVGLLCRDVFVSLAEAIFDAGRHTAEGQEAPTGSALRRHRARGSRRREQRTACAPEGSDRSRQQGSARPAGDKGSGPRSCRSDYRCGQRSTRAHGNGARDRRSGRPA
jgi:hypothetical protein